MKWYWILLLILVSGVVGTIVLMGVTFGILQLSTRKRVAAKLPAEYRPRLDVVYTWCDVADPAFAQRRAAARGLTYNPDQKRCTSSGELRYSIQATQAYCRAFLGHIYVVVDQEAPAWAADLEGVTFVPQSELLPSPAKEACFNSNVIEMYVNEIPNLSEWFLYMNDDFFINQPLDWEHLFVEPGVARFYHDSVGINPTMATVLTLGLEPTSTSRRYSEQILNALGPEFRHYKLLPAHAPVVVHRPSVRELRERLAPEVLNKALGHTFRTTDDLVLLTFMYLHYMVGQGKGVFTSDYATFYMHLTGNEWLNRKQFEHIQRHSRRYTFFCINDSRGGNFESSSRQIERFLEEHVAGQAARYQASEMASGEKASATNGPSPIPEEETTEEEEPEAPAVPTNVNSGNSGRSPAGTTKPPLALSPHAPAGNLPSSQPAQLVGTAV